jgi:hypothetical protein
MSLHWRYLYNGEKRNIVPLLLAVRRLEPKVGQPGQFPCTALTVRDRTVCWRELSGERMLMQFLRRGAGLACCDHLVGIHPRGHDWWWMTS